MRFLIASVVLVLGLICAPISARAGSSTPADLVVTSSDNGKVITLKVGQRLVVKLETGGGTPYSWFVLTEPGSPLRFVQAPKPPKPPQPARKSDLPMVGGTVDASMAFSAAAEFGGAYPVTVVKCAILCDSKDAIVELFSVRVTVTK